MVTAATPAMPVPTLAGYQMRLPAYEGPLDVLLRLIERQQLAITDVSLVEVTGQFLRHVEEMHEAPPEVIAEFTAMGTRLTLLKSRSLLPRPPKQEDETEPDPNDLVRQLQEYQRLKGAARALEARRAAGMASFSPGGTGSITKPSRMAPVRLARYEPTVLIRSLRRRLSAMPRVIQTIRHRRIVSLREMVDRVLAMTAGVPGIRFGHVTRDYRTRSERATAFLAVLVLIRRRALDASQDGLFGEIRLTQRLDASPEDFDRTAPEFLN